MLVEEAIASILDANAGVQALAPNRIYAPILPERCGYPAAAVRVIGTKRVELLESPGASQLRRVAFIVFSTAHGPGGYADAKNLDAAIYTALQGYSGTVISGSSPPDTISIQGIFQETSFDAYDDATQTQQVMSRYVVWAR